MSKGKTACRNCGEIFGAMTERELDDMELLLRTVNPIFDLWNALGTMPRPSVLRRLIDEVRARRAFARDVYMVSEKNSVRGVTAESVLEALKEKK